MIEREPNEKSALVIAQKYASQLESAKLMFNAMQKYPFGEDVPKIIGEYLEEETLIYPSDWENGIRIKKGRLIDHNITNAIAGFRIWCEHNLLCKYEMNIVEKEPGQWVTTIYVGGDFVADHESICNIKTDSKESASVNAINTFNFYPYLLNKNIAILFCQAEEAPSILSARWQMSENVCSTILTKGIIACYWYNKTSIEFGSEMISDIQAAESKALEVNQHGVDGFAKPIPFAERVAAGTMEEFEKSCPDFRWR